MCDSKFIESLPNIIHFENAIRSNKLKLMNKIVALSEKEHIDRNAKDYFHTVFSLIDELYLYLRSPITSNYFLDVLANNLISNHLNENYTIHLTGILASSTALQEVIYFTRFIDIFNHYKMNAFAYLLLVYWEDDIPNNNDREGYEDFYAKQLAIEKILGNKSNIQLIPLHLSYKNHQEPLVSFLNQKFFHYVNNIYQSLSQDKIKDPLLVKEKEWIVNFYQRQNSLKNFTVEKTLFDLAIRQAIGKFEKDIIALHLQKYEHAISLMLASELNKRFLTCYNSPVPILNIKLNTDP